MIASKELVFTNSSADELVVELAKEVHEGFHIVSVREEYSYHEGRWVTVNLERVHRT